MQIIIIKLIVHLKIDKLKKNIRHCKKFCNIRKVEITQIQQKIYITILKFKKIKKIIIYLIPMKTKYNKFNKFIWKESRKKNKRLILNQNKTKRKDFSIKNSTI